MQDLINENNDKKLVYKQAINNSYFYHCQSNHTRMRGKTFQLLGVNTLRLADKINPNCGN